MLNIVNAGSAAHSRGRAMLAEAPARILRQRNFGVARIGMQYRQYVPHRIILAPNVDAPSKWVDAGYYGPIASARKVPSSLVTPASMS